MVLAPARFIRKLALLINRDAFNAEYRHSLGNLRHRSSLMILLSQISAKVLEESTHLLGGPRSRLLQNRLQAEKECNVTVRLLSAYRRACPRNNAELSIERSRSRFHRGL